MKTAVAAGQVEVLAHEPALAADFGVRVVIHATPRGPRHAPAVSETVIDASSPPSMPDSALAPAAAAVAAALAPRFTGMTEAEIEALAAGGSVPGPLFTSPAFVVKGNYVQISPCDERCQVGQVVIRPDADGHHVQFSGELFALRAVAD
jgi:hypothetical protein